ncbi:MAG: aminopeptidase P family protein [Chloroflexi bacterium]|nr:aminopeptidase P family protein [Chloroflexota bacterium]
MNEFETKQRRIQAFLQERGLDALLLRQVSNFAWATCGKSSCVNTASSLGEATLLITPGNRYLFANNIESPRLDEEEGLKEQGWEFHTAPWWEENEALVQITAGLKVGADMAFPAATDISGDLVRLRSQLTPAEGERFRTLGHICAEAMDDAIFGIQPGMSEYEIAARLAFETQRRGAQPIVNLIATDERIFRYRHPLPTAKKLDRYAMLVLCGRKQGLVASITRLVYFGALPAELRQKAEAVAGVDAAFIAATRPGAVLGHIFSQIQTAYAAAGFADEWRLHHQGGPASYDPRDFVATPTSPEVVVAGQAYAWNPSITGTKSEDTILVGEQRNDVITAIAGWPVLTVEIDGQSYQRPAILEVK